MSWSVRFRIRQYIKNSLWLLPLIAGLGGLVLAELIYWLDTRSDLAVLQYSPETATAVVSATIAAAVSLTGFVVTVTVLGVQQATGIFSPRYMRLWYRDGRLKLVLAELVGTLMFSIAVIRRIRPDSVPDISVSLTGGGLAVGLLLFLLYLDRFLHRMRPVAVAELLAREGRRAFEDWMEETDSPDLVPVPGGTWAPSTTPGFVLRATRSGTIQAVDIAGLSAVAAQHACLVVFRHSVGDFVPVGAAILEVHGATLPAGAGEHLSTMLALGSRADDRAGPRLRHPRHGRHRHPGALPGRERSDDRRAGARPPRGDAATGRGDRGTTAWSVARLLDERRHHAGADVAGLSGARPHRDPGVRRHEHPGDAPPARLARRAG